MKVETYLRIREKSKSNINEILQVAEESSFYLSEEIIKSVWYKHGYKNELYTTDGEKVIVISPGDYNSKEGPDFVNAKIVVGEKQITTDVEVHRKKSDWIRHRHSKNKNYKNTKLHIFFENDTGKINYDLYEICLKNKINEEFYSTLDIIDNKYVIKKENLCGRNLSHRDYSYLEELLEAAARSRCLFKSEQFSLWFSTQNKEEQLLYERIAEVFGYINNRENFLLLSRILTLKKIRKILKLYRIVEHKKMLEAMFFGVSGFLDESSENEYLQKLKSLWDKELKRYFNKTIHKNRWRYYKTMPLGYPERKIFALSHFVSKFISIKLNSYIIKVASMSEKEVVRHYTNIFYIPAEGYFATRVAFNSKQMNVKYALFGLEKVYVMLSNVIFPFLIYKVKNDKKLYYLEEKIWNIYSQIEYCEKNKVLDSFMNTVIVYPEYHKYFKSKLIFSQGFIQLYKDFCEPNKGDCKHCGLSEVFRYKPTDESKKSEYLSL